MHRYALIRVGDFEVAKGGGVWVAIGALTIDPLALHEGKLPARVLSLVIEWSMEHQSELMANWNNLRTTGEFHRIAPLV